MVTPTQTLAEVMNDLSSDDAQIRVRGILNLSKRNDVGYEAVMKVGRLIEDRTQVDTNPDYGPRLVFLPRFVPSVSLMASVFVSDIAESSPNAILDVVRSVPNMNEGDRNVAFDIFKNIASALVKGLSVWAKVLISADDSEIGKLCSILKEIASAKLQPLVDAFSSPQEERARNVVQCIAGESRDHLVVFASEIGTKGTRAIPYLSEIIKYSAAHPHGLIGKYNLALKAIESLQKLGPEAKDALNEGALSPVKDISAASKKALKHV